MEQELITLFLGLVFIIIGIYLYLKGVHLLANGKKAIAKIIDNRYEFGSKSGVYYPVIEFVNDRDELIIHEFNFGTSMPESVGKRYEILYDPTDLSNVSVNSVFQIKVLPLVFFAIGVAVVTLSVLDFFNFINLFNN